jgi:hypothetical protein
VISFTKAWSNERSGLVAETYRALTIKDEQNQGAPIVRSSGVKASRQPETRQHRQRLQGYVEVQALSDAEIWGAVRSCVPATKVGRRTSVIFRSA